MIPDDTAPATRRDVAHHLRRIWQEAVDGRRPLPGEHALATELGVSRPHLREQLVKLEREGLIYRRRGADTLVNLAAGDIDLRLDQQLDYGRMLRGRGHEVEVEVIAASQRPLDETEADFFEVDKEWTALCIVKRWRADGEVLILADDLLAVPPTVRLQEVDLAAEIAMLAETHRGTSIEWTIAVPGAVALDDTETTQLEQPSGSVALTLETVGVGRTGQRVFRARELHVPGRLRFGFIRSRSHD